MGGDSLSRAVLHMPHNGAARRFREQMAEGGLEIVGDTSVASPHVMTIALPKNIDSSALARELADRGLLVAYASDYLHQRNWIQVCLMSEFTTSSLDRLAWELTSRIQDSRLKDSPPPESLDASIAPVCHARL